LSIGDAIVFDIAQRHVALSLGGTRVADMGGRYEEVSEVDLADLVQHQNTRMTIEGMFGHLSLLMDDISSNHDDVYDFREYLTDELELPRESRLPEPLSDYIDKFAALKSWPESTERVVRSIVSRVSSPPLYRIPKAVWIKRIKDHVPGS
jgi:hypothetical protein